VKTGFEINSQEISHEIEGKTPFHKNTDEIYQGYITKPGDSFTNNKPSLNIKEVGFNIFSEETSRPGENSKKEDDLITKIGRKIKVKNSNKIPMVKMKHPTPLTHPTPTHSLTTYSMQNHKERTNQGLVTITTTPPTHLVTLTTSPTTQSTQQPKEITGTTATSILPPTPGHKSQSLKKNPTQGKTFKRIRKVGGNQEVDRPKIINGSILKKKINKLKERVRKKKSKKNSFRIQVASKKKNNLGRIRKSQVENQDKEGQISTSEDMEGKPQGEVKHHTGVIKKTGFAHNWNDPILTLILEVRRKPTRVGIKTQKIPTRRKFYSNEGTRIPSLDRSSAIWCSSRTIVGRGRPPEHQDFLSVRKIFKSWQTH